MKRAFKTSSALLAFLFSAVLCLGSFYQLSGMNVLENRVSYLWETQESMPTAAEIYQLHQGELPLNVLWWTTAGKQEIVCKQLQRQVSAPTLALCGSSAVLFPEVTALEYGDTDRCLLGRETAARLFGDNRVEGLRVSFAGRECEVTGVLQNIRELFVYELAAGEKRSLQRFTVSCNGSERKAVVRNQAEGLYAPEILLDFDLLYFLGQLISLIVPACFWWTALGVVRKSELKKLVRLVLLWGMPLLFLFFSVSWLKVPVDCIPVRWSDFDFWRDLWREKMNGLERFFTTALMPSDMLWIKPLMKAVIFETGSVVFFAYGSGGWKSGEECGNVKDRIKECVENLRKKYRGGKTHKLNR